VTSILERTGITAPADDVATTPATRRPLAVLLILVSVALGAWAALAAADADALGDPQQVVRLVSVAA
jgi:hypothetical protein